MAAGDRLYASDFRNGEAHYGTRATSSGATITAETAYLRVDNLVLYSGRSYRFWTSPLSLKGSVVGDIVEARFRFSTAGPAGTANTLLNNVRAYINIAATPARLPLQARYSPGANLTTASLLLSIIRHTAGAGSTGVQLVASATEPVDLVIEDMGPAVANSGIAL